MNLSVPFSVTSEVAGDAINKINGSSFASKIGDSLKGINFKNWRTWVVVCGALVVLYLLFRGIQNSEPYHDSPPSQEPSPEEFENLPEIPRENPLEIAQRHHKMMENTVSPEKIHHYIVATQNYEKALYDIPPSSPGFGEIAYKLARLYHTGVAEHYDSMSEQKVEGVPPDTDKAILFYQQAISSGFHSAVLEMASIFHWGNVGFKPNREYAKHLYGVVLKIGNDYEQGIARDRLRQMHEEEGKISGSAVLDGIEGVGNSFSGNNFNTTPFTEEFCGVFTGGDAQNNKIGQDDLTKDIDDNYVDEVMINDLRINTNRLDDSNGNIRRKKNNTTPVISPIIDDPHNARDHIVMNTVRQSLEKLRASTHIQDDEHTTIKKLHAYIVRECDLPEIKRRGAMRVLKMITESAMDNGEGSLNNTSIRQKELEALSLIFNRINSRHRDKKEKEKLMDNLVSELNECLEYGELICSEGIVNRIVDSLNFIDEEVKIKPKWALSREMLYKAANIRKDLLKESRSEIKDALQCIKPTARQRMLSREFKEKLKREIERKFNQDYVDTGVMTKDLLKTEMSKWIDEI